MTQFSDEAYEVTLRYTVPVVPEHDDTLEDFIQTAEEVIREGGHEPELKNIEEIR